MLDDRGPAIVSIKFILKGGEQEKEEEATGVVIDPSGLILASNLEFGGQYARMGGPTPIPSEIKVLIGDDTQGLEAKFLARDTELGLAWMQLKDAPAKPLNSVDFAKGVNAKVGDGLYVVSLMGKFFDRVPAMSEGRVSALVKKPRELVIPSFGLASTELGIPVFNEKGEVIGVTTLILPDEEEVAGIPGGMRAALRGVTRSMILPAAEVVAATKRAKETAANAPAATEEPKAEEPKAEEKKDEVKPAEQPK